MTETQNEIHVARNHKDRLFRMIFREKKELLSLYNAVNGTSYMVAKDPEAAIRIRSILAQNPPNSCARFVDMALSDKGLQISRS